MQFHDCDVDDDNNDGGCDFDDDGVDFNDAYCDYWDADRYSNGVCDGDKYDDDDVDDDYVGDALSNYQYDMILIITSSCCS